MRSRKLLAISSSDYTCNMMAKFFFSSSVKEARFLFINPLLIYPYTKIICQYWYMNHGAVYLYRELLKSSINNMETPSNPFAL